MSQISQTSLQDLNDASRKDILQFIESENSKSKVQMSIHNFTDMCFKKCNENRPITSNTLTPSEEKCLQNCLNRFLDTNIKVVQTLQAQR
ncbi:mitochondrial import inner membrane translocase subunit TIM8 [Metschnikowia bicuspidata]|uniref:Mitochondrial import inner membrane translocase subunit n=1 Tax=Metschnikowia bicuspidata TaxID=27322 RepID=A0A4P9ZBV9_9ASCO|nr:mitochondrial import inner membrane translocase subunit TIM8 [Metschnikowia bicuspidata]